LAIFQELKNSLRNHVQSRLRKKTCGGPRQSAKMDILGLNRKSLFAIRYSLFAIRYSLFANRKFHDRGGGLASTRHVQTNLIVSAYVQIIDE